MDQDDRETGVDAGTQTGTQQGTSAVPAAATGATTASGEGTGPATRSQHVVQTLAHDWGAIPQFLAGALERLDAADASTQLLVVTPDAETALAVADAALTLRPDAAHAPVLAVTRVERAVRQLRARPAAAVAGDPGALAALLEASALKLDGVRTLILAWADAILETPGADTLDAVLAELPKDAARLLVAAETTDEVEALIERALRRPRRVAPTATGSGTALPLQYLVSAPSARPLALRRLLDELDPASAAVLVQSDVAEAEVRRAARTLGYAVAGNGATASGEGADDATPAAGQLLAGAESAPVVTVTRGEVPAQAGLAVLYDLPASREALERIVAARPAQLVALVQPRQLAALRALAAGPLRPLALRDLARREAARDVALRAELRGELQRGLPARELLALEELLADFDGVELAAAALRLLERERARRAVAHATSAGAGATAGAAGAPNAGSGMTKLFVGVGTRDNARPGDLVGAIAGEAGITADRIGKIDLRESFTLVEVASADAARVVEKLNGIAIRGRRVVVREERERPPREGRFEGRGDRGDRPERGERRDGERRGPGGGERRSGGFGEGRGSGERRGVGFGDRRAPGGSGGGARFDARRDGPRGFGATDDRDVRERAEQRGEWAERAERLRRARRGPAGFEADGGEAPNERAERPDRADAGGFDADREG